MPTRNEHLGSGQNEMPEMDKDQDKGTQAQQSGGITGSQVGFESGASQRRLQQPGADRADRASGGQGAYGGFEGRSGNSHATHASMYRGPERRRSQNDWERWQQRDRRMNSFTYGG